MISFRKALRHFFLGYTDEEVKEEARVHWDKYTSHGGIGMPPNLSHPDDLLIPGFLRLIGKVLILLLILIAVPIVGLVFGILKLTESIKTRMGPA